MIKGNRIRDTTKLKWVLRMSKKIFFTKKFALFAFSFALLLFLTKLIYVQSYKDDGIVRIMGQCIHKSFYPLVSYHKSEKVFNSFSEVVDSTEDGRSGFMSTTFPTDKATDHDYFTYYDKLVQPYLQKARNGEVIRVLEIGIKKGGFIKILRELFPATSFVHGVDIDFTVPVFSRDAHIKIITPLDSTDCCAVDEAFAGLDSLKFDMIFDDGLHTSHGIYKTFKCFRGMLKDDGVYLLEDMYRFSKKFFKKRNMKYSIHPDLHEKEKLVVLYPPKSLAIGTLRGMDSIEHSKGVL